MLVDEQNGFRRDRNCNDHIFVLTTILSNRLNTKLNTLVVFIDFQKAFDFVDRELLLYRLLNANVKGKMYYSIRALLSNTTSCVRINQGHMTNWFNVGSGVRQGDSISSTLFILFLNDLLQALINTARGVKFGEKMVTCLAYADDLAILAENEDDLEYLLDFLCTWCIKWRVRINSDKTKIIQFRKRGQSQTHHEFRICGNVIGFVNTYKYLGVMLDAHLSFTTHAHMLSQSAERALGSIIASYKSMKMMGFKTYTKLFDSCVQPILDYGAPVWPLKKFENIENVPNRALRVYVTVTGQMRLKSRFFLSSTVNRSPRICKNVKFWIFDQKFTF